MISLKRQRYRQASKHWGSSFLVFLLGLLPAGCGGSYGEISGKVLYKGQPLIAPGATVTFRDASGGIFSSSVASDGKYAIGKIPAGEVKIGVVVLPPRRNDRMRQLEQEAIRSGNWNMPAEELQKLSPTRPPGKLTIALPPSYADPEKSGLMHTVTGGKQTYDIELR